MAFQLGPEAKSNYRRPVTQGMVNAALIKWRNADNPEDKAMYMAEYQQLADLLKSYEVGRLGTAGTRELSGMGKTERERLDLAQDYQTRAENRQMERFRETIGLQTAQAKELARAGIEGQKELAVVEAGLKERWAKFQENLSRDRALYDQTTFVEKLLGNAPPVVQRSILAGFENAMKASAQKLQSGEIQNQLDRLKVRIAQQGFENSSRPFGDVIDVSSLSGLIGSEMANGLRNIPSSEAYKIIDAYTNILDAKRKQTLGEVATQEAVYQAKAQKVPQDLRGIFDQALSGVGQLQFGKLGQQKQLFLERLKSTLLQQGYTALASNPEGFIGQQIEQYWREKRRGAGNKTEAENAYWMANP